MHTNDIMIAETQQQYVTLWHTSFQGPFRLQVEQP
jgi:hypothetical protein